MLPESSTSFEHTFSTGLEGLGPAVAILEESSSLSAIHKALLGSGTNWQHFAVLP